MPDTDQTTELFLQAQGYEQHRIRKALACLSGEDQDPSSVSPILTPKELCAQLKVSMTTLWRLDPPHIYVGSRKRYRLSEVQEFLAQRQGSCRKKCHD